MQTNIVTAALVLVVFLIAGSQGETGAPCRVKADCAAGECCQIINIIVASKKRHLSRASLLALDSGTCQPYKLNGAYCDSIEVMNGFCGCAEGLTCRTIHEGRKRGALPPGYVQRCLP